MFLGAWLHWRVPLSLPCAQDPHSSLGDLAPSGPQEGLIALPPAHQATSGMRVRGRSAEGGLRVPDGRTSVWWWPWCAWAPRPWWSARRRALPRGGGVSSLGGGAGAGAVPAHYLPPTHPQRQEGYPPGGGNPGPPQAGSFGVSPTYPIRQEPGAAGAEGGRGRVGGMRESLSMGTS